MNGLSNILSSTARAKVFAQLFGLDDAELYMREIERRTGLVIGAIQQELKNLSELELVISRRDGNRLYYRANKNHPLYPDIHSLVVKTTGAVPLLVKALRNQDIKSAFIFGSLARNEATPASDLDLMVIGSIGLRTLASLLSKVSKEIGREINPHVLSEAEFFKRIKTKEHFISRVLNEPKLFIIGNENELTTMGK